MNLRFPGQYADATTYRLNGFRYYNTGPARYMQVDPIGLAGGMNPYVYAGNNGYKNIDPWGLDWVYSQSTGTIAHYKFSFMNPPDSLTSTIGGLTPDYVASGYSGTNDDKKNKQCACGLNNPDEQDVPFIGPIPQGEWTIGAQYNNRSTGHGTMNLSPGSETNTFGRTLFRIHGDNGKNNHSASEGCIIAGPNIRNKIAKSDDHRLIVVP